MPRRERISSPPSPCQQGGIVGEGKGQTILQCTDSSSADMITWTAGASIGLFRDFQIVGSAKSSGVAINVNPASGDASYLTVDGVLFNVCPSGLKLLQERELLHRGRPNAISSTTPSAGIDISNTTNPDAGDSFISNYFLQPRPCWWNWHLAPLLRAAWKIVLHQRFLGGMDGYVLSYDGAGNMARHP